ncbi:hypothetical protein D3OALGA1CA_2494 [Olavius algarvensis associated proteobacterium Delta 3]|nr:hypothetical protein D3OALGA1CA_2494 [Olavius algarvensis associated proteobacterium Delta 3]CAB5154523.1 hypothetical protein D3OALGB2SA_5015 [Olavius algarvensis associated proteobacterium Delta 3]
MKIFLKDRSFVFSFLTKRKVTYIKKEIAIINQIQKLI